MADNLYDEFGNYIGPDLGDDSDGFSDESDDEGDWDEGLPDMDDGKTTLDPEEQNFDEQQMSVVEYDEANSMQIVLHEDKNYYKDAEEVYPDAEVRVEDEDTQPLETPIVASLKTKKFALVEDSFPDTTFSYKFLTGLMDHPRLVRHIALIGHFHHGKTSLMDMFVQQTHLKDWDLNKELRYTDTRIDEQERGLSIKAMPMSLILPRVSGKSVLCNIMDTPGHVNFADEQTAALRLADGAVVVVDAVEGVMCQTRTAIELAVKAKVPISLVINKVDRLIVELKLPPTDAYHKLNHTLEEVNDVLERSGYNGRVSPELGNVCFASSLHRWIFSIQSFAKIYSDYHQNFAAKDLAARLWGNYYLHSDRKFRTRAEDPDNERTFVSFILEPLYKIYSYVLGAEGRQLELMLQEIGVRLKKEQFKLDVKPLLKLILGQFFGDTASFVEMVFEHFDNPVDSATTKVNNTYSGDLTTECGAAMLECDKKGPLMINITKQYARSDCSRFDSFGRVLSGTVRVGDQVKVLAEGYSLDDREDMTLQEVTKIWVFQGRYRVEVNRVTAGNWALFEGLDAGITKTATITSSKGNENACIFHPLQFYTDAVMKVAIEPINPSELPKMLDGLRSISKTYPLSTTKVEESGEHIILGTGELYMDCILHDLRKMYSEIEIKVADPVARFCETVIETSSMKCFAETPNQKNKLTMIAEPLEQGIAEDIELGKVKVDWDSKQVSKFFQSKYSWDLLAARSIWHFGPEQNGPNILCDDTLTGETDKALLYDVKESIIQGFQWGTKEGPLCDEPIRNVKFRVLSAEFDEDPILRSRGQIIPTARRVAYSAFLLATPRLMEPVYSVEIQCPADCVPAIHNVLARRRGAVTGSEAKPGTPLFTVSAFIPLIDSFGFETDLRTHTQGQTFCLSQFDHWEVVPGDPLDKSIVLRPLEPAPIDALAREFMIKTRRRKGLSEDVSINKFFDDPMLMELAQQDADLEGYFQMSEQ